MFRFTIYKNSILATLCSLFGTALIAMAVLSMFSGELEILHGLCAIALGAVFVILAGEISERKERRKKVKAAQKAAHAAGNPAPARPSKAAHPATPRKTTVAGMSADKAMRLAKPLFLLAAGCGFWAFYLYNSRDLDIPFDDRLPLVMFVEAVLYLVMRTGNLTETAGKQHIFGFMGCAAFNAFVGGSIFLDSDGRSVLIIPFVLKVAAFLLMAVFILLSKRRFEQYPLVLWLVPAVLLAAAGLKMAYDNYALSLLFSQRFHDGMVLTARPEYPELFAHLLGAAAMGFIGCCGYLLTPVSSAQVPKARQAAQINCPHCYQANSPESLFCENCGQKLTRPQTPPKGFCHQCGHQNSSDSTFCQNCGQRLR